MVIVLLSMVFYGIFHSILASKESKARFKAQFGERAYHGLYRLCFNIIAVITFTPIAALIVFAETGTIWTLSLDWEPILFIIQALGILGFVISLMQIDLLRFLGVSQAWAYYNDDPLPLPQEELATGGIYRLVRHPLYLFSLMLIWPVTTMTDAYFGFALGATLYFVVGSYYEEKRLLATFGDDYAAYQRQVPWLIPFVKLN